MTPPGQSTTVEWLGEELLSHQASIDIVFLPAYGNGWQVVITNPGGRSVAHGGDLPLLDTIARAIEHAEAEGWW